MHGGGGRRTGARNEKRLSRGAILGCRAGAGAAQSHVQLLVAHLCERNHALNVIPVLRWAQNSARHEVESEPFQNLLSRSSTPSRYDGLTERGGEQIAWDSK